MCSSCSCIQTKMAQHMYSWWYVCIGWVRRIARLYQRWIQPNSSMNADRYVRYEFSLKIRKISSFAKFRASQISGEISRTLAFQKFWRNLLKNYFAKFSNSSYSTVYEISKWKKEILQIKYLQTFTCIGKPAENIEIAFENVSYNVIFSFCHR
jgi:hypothetical protein